MRRFGQLLVGLAGYGTSLALLVQSELGASSWNILAEGLSLRSGLTFGWATNLTSAAVLIFWIPLREVPAIGTVLNVLLVGTSADVATRLISTPDSLSQQLVLYSLGLLMFTFLDAVYLGSRLGSGPRDGLMTGAARVFGRPLWIVRTGIDVTVLTIGWILGGTVGFGTVLIALAAGPLIQSFLRHTTVRLEADRLMPT